ncbi:hypothetical protein KR615_03260 [Acinetobacter baumannii]|nr:hypothetical protein [Acinetobacter baumannii]
MLKIIRIDIDLFFQQSEMELTKWRTQIREIYKRDKNNPRFTCLFCESPVTLARRMDHMSMKNSPTFFFKHFPEFENNPQFFCPVKDINKLSAQEKNILKYKMAKESQEHKLLKYNIENSLKVDKDFDNIRVESVCKSIDLSEWRKPDVSALYLNKLIVFEGQLSTTFLNVIIDRKVFYQDNNACLIRIFDRFKPNEKVMKQSIQDIYYNNNANAFVVDNFTLLESIKERKFILECNYLKPEVKNNKIVNKWEKKFISFKDLTLNKETNQIYYFDYESEYFELKKKLGLRIDYLEEDREISLKDKNELLGDFIDLWSNARYLSEAQFNAKWFLIYSDLEKLNINVPKNILRSPFKTVINSILSAKLGYVIGYQITDLVGVAQNLMEHHPEYIKHFLLTLKVTKKNNLLKNDLVKYERWIKRYSEYIRQPDSLKIYKHDLNDFIEFLVPEFEGRLKEWGCKN